MLSHLFSFFLTNIDLWTESTHVKGQLVRNQFSFSVTISVLGIKFWSSISVPHIFTTEVSHRSTTFVHINVNQMYKVRDFTVLSSHIHMMHLDHIYPMLPLIPLPHSVLILPYRPSILLLSFFPFSTFLAQYTFLKKGKMTNKCYV